MTQTYMGFGETSLRHQPDLQKYPWHLRRDIHPTFSLSPAREPHDCKQTANGYEFAIVPFTSHRISNFPTRMIFVELGAPPIIQIANNFGYDSTSLPIDVNSKVINATLGNAVEDLTRQAAGILNLATDDTGKVPDYNADFILDSKDVAALSVLVLVSVPCDPALPVFG
ncbi:hypothetical protein BDD12DRAFT_809362 [Trichophaea hybrida]|nr:hypothetical protein BDD12DRAFT_809362 [Trichophaea hybrida]